MRKCKQEMADELLPLLGINIGQDRNRDSDSEDDGDESEGDDRMEEEEEEEENEEVEEEKKSKSKPEKNKKQKIERKKDNIHMTFDQALPVSHSYLGDDLEELRGRTVLDENCTVTLPIVQLPGMVLVPGQTIPLHLFHQHTVAMIKDNSSTIANIGTTAEIYSVKDETDDHTGLSSIRVKARGRQRFEILETKRSPTGILMAKVAILPEKNFLLGARPDSHCKFCCRPEEGVVTHTAVDRNGQVLASISMLNNRQINKFTSAYCTPWPPWVYEMYDPELVVERIKKELQQWNNTLNPEKLPNDAIELSYWVAQNLPLDDTRRLNLLSLNNAIQRLRCALSIIQKCSVLCCKDCNVPISHKTEVFCMSVEGPLGAYVNPGGHIHETLTVYKVQNVDLIGRPTKEHSWFPGYAWTIAQCKSCNSHLGWRFTATKRNLTPEKFYGITRASVVPGLEQQDEENEWMPSL
ncbi:hypothetical protein KUTeg_020372 [Tegillarca granosa]|uniref:Protein cereblon n=1 Tax=Tegillarca granosa TaxID=220873 RepID=A0ABQ9E891_TEGGR|nr:hypothetical protein KUTeg_020372 [Tegillarca granosa]